MELIPIREDLEFKDKIRIISSDSFRKLKYIPVIETLSELLSLPNSQVNIADEEFRGFMESYVTDVNFVFNGEVKNVFYKVNGDFNFWHGFTLYKFKQNEHYIYSNDEYIQLK